MYSRQLVILFVNENGTAEKVGINQIYPANIVSIFVLLCWSSHIRTALNALKLWDNASTDEDLSAVNMPIKFVSSLLGITYDLQFHCLVAKLTEDSKQIYQKNRGSFNLGS